MASISEASLREAITQRLGAIHVEVTDMSGMPSPYYISKISPPTLPLHLPPKNTQLPSVITKPCIQY
jgi:hypothetical protein